MSDSEFAVGTQSDEIEVALVGFAVDENKVRSYMAVPLPPQVAPHGMVLVLLRHHRVSH